MALDEEFAGASKLAVHESDGGGAGVAVPFAWLPAHCAGPMWRACFLRTVVVVALSAVAIGFAAPELVTQVCVSVCACVRVAAQ